jgi:hypothetical protein
MTKFNFDDHRAHKKSYKILIRFIIYGVVILILLYLINNQSKTAETPQNKNLQEIEEVDIELDLDA